MKAWNTQLSHWPRACLPRFFAQHRYGDVSPQQTAAHVQDRYASGKASGAPEVGLIFGDLKGGPDHSDTRDPELEALVAIRLSLAWTLCAANVKTIM